MPARCQGEAAQASTGTSAVVEPGATPDRPILRVRSSRAIDEPVLHLRVRVGCQGSTSRDFVLLADPPPVLAAVPPPAVRSLSAAPGPVAGRDANASPVAQRPVARSGAGGPVGDAARSPRTVRSGQSQAVPAQPRATPARRPAAAAAPSKAAAPRASAPAAAGGRLKLDALEPLPPLASPSTAGVPAAARPKTVESTPPAPAIPAPLVIPAPTAGAPTATVTAPSPATAVTPVPSETLAEVQRTTQLEAALAELRAQARQNQQTLAELRTELAEARDNRYSNPLVYALLLLLLMAAAALWALWRIARRAPESPWTAAPPKQGLRSRLARRRASARPDADDDEPSQPPMYFPTAVSRRGQLTDADDEEDGLPETEDGGRGGVWDRAERVAVSPPLGRALDVDELFDVQQQAEFFTSLGQHDQAIDALRHYVNEHPQASALAYLELLHLYHQLQRESEYEHLRQQCQDALNVRVPGFHEFGAVGGRTLEQYPEARARWSSTPRRAHACRATGRIPRRWR